jgi:hypothetical protein
VGAGSRTGNLNLGGADLQPTNEGFGRVSSCGPVATLSVFVRINGCRLNFSPGEEDTHACDDSQNLKPRAPSGAFSFPIIQFPVSDTRLACRSRAQVCTDADAAMAAFAPRAGGASKFTRPVAAAPPFDEDQRKRLALLDTQGRHPAIYLLIAEPTLCSWLR